MQEAMIWLSELLYTFNIILPEWKSLILKLKQLSELINEIQFYMWFILWR